MTKVDVGLRPAWVARAAATAGLVAATAVALVAHAVPHLLASAQG